MFKTLRFILIPVVVLLFSGCNSQSDIDASRKENQTIVSSLNNAEYVGTLPNGNKLYRYALNCMSEDQNRVHYVYYIDSGDDSQPITVNHDVHEGKTEVNQTEVMINGKVYVPKQ